ncbi:MAG: hypothetical protein DRO01_07060 [Thermoproteota archaeon]|nr:MAG: hypothetical protein DRO01_07060 [Candidatus Korarchaeota archaeon]
MSVIKVGPKAGMLPSDRLEVSRTDYEEFLTILNSVRFFETTINGQTYKFDLLKQVFIDPHALTDSYMEQASLVAWWSSLASRLRTEYQKQKLRVKRLRAQIALEYRAGIRKPPISGKLTNDAVEALVDTTREVQIEEDTLLQLEEKLETVKGVIEALRHRREMLISMGIEKREEMRATGMSV